MKNRTLISLLAAAATAVAVPTLAAADRPQRGGWSSGWTSLGTVDTHKDDAEDFVPVSPARHFDSLTIQSRGGVVPLDGVKIQYTDGRIFQPYARGVLRPGQRMTIDIPDNEPPIKMIVLDYGARNGRDLRARADAKVEVLAFDDGRGDRRDRRDDRYDRDDAYDNRTDTRGRVYTTPYQNNNEPRFVWRGGIFVRVN